MTNADILRYRTYTDLMSFRNPTHRVDVDLKHVTSFSSSRYSRYVAAFDPQGNHVLVRTSMQAIEAALRTDPRFLRVARAHIVNLDHVVVVDERRRKKDGTRMFYDLNIHVTGGRLVRSGRVFTTQEVREILFCPR